MYISMYFNLFNTIQTLFNKYHYTCHIFKIIINNIYLHKYPNKNLPVIYPKFKINYSYQKFYILNYYLIFLIN